MKRGILLKFWTFIFLIIAAPLSGKQPASSNSKISQSKIIITGKSTLQNFTILYYFQKQLKSAAPINENSYSPKQTELQIPVNELLFSNRHMKKAFLNLVHANRYPFINLFYAPEIFKGKFDKQYSKIISLTMQISSIQKTYQVPVIFIKKNRFYTEMKGDVQIKLSDFNLKPRKYLLGLIHIKDLLKINFVLYFKISNYPKVKERPDES